MGATVRRDRLEAVQLLRGVAALLVVIVHAAFSSDHLFGPGKAWLSPTGRFHGFGQCGVDMFFVISGFIMAYTIDGRPEQSARRFLADRAVRVIPYYWLIAALFGVSMYLSGREFTFDRIINGVAMFPIMDASGYVIPLLPVGWSLSFELAFYGMVALGIAAAGSSQRRLPIVLKLATFLAIAGWIIRPATDLLAVLLNPIWLEFVLGLSAYKLWRSTAGKPMRPSGVALALCGTAVLTATALFGVWFSGEPDQLFDNATGLSRTIAWGLPSAAILLGLLWCTQGTETRSASPSLGRRIMGLIGDASYSLYLVHLLVIYLCETYAAQEWLGPNLTVVALTGLSVVVALACYFLVERPLLVALRKLVAIWPASRRIVSRHELSTSI